MFPDLNGKKDKEFSKWGKSVRVLANKNNHNQHKTFQLIS